MDSRDIYNLTKRNLEFEKDWIHIGIGDYLNLKKLNKQLTSHFNNYRTIMVKRNRTNSEEIKFETLIDKIVELIGVEDFELWSSDFKRAIKFNKVGVMNKSKYTI